jgi:DMSO reductase anchor subunit
MDEYEVLDLSLRNLALYIMLLGLIVDGTVKTIKSAIYWFTKNEEKLKEFNMLNVVLPLVVGVVVVLIFNVSPWSWLPFAPNSRIMDIVLSGIIISRGSNISHDMYTMITGLIGRISKNFTYWG